MSNTDVFVKYHVLCKNIQLRKLSLSLNHFTKIPLARLFDRSDTTNTKRALISIHDGSTIHADYCKFEGGWLFRYYLLECRVLRFIMSDGWPQT